MVSRNENAELSIAATAVAYAADCSIVKFLVDMIALQVQARYKRALRVFRRGLSKGHLWSRQKERKFCCSFLPLESCRAERSRNAAAMSLFKPLEPLAAALTLPSGSLHIISHVTFSQNSMDAIGFCCSVLSDCDAFCQ